MVYFINKIRLVTKEDTMFCSKCGNSLTDSQRFCPICGTPNSPIPNMTQEKSMQKPASPAIKTTGILAVVDFVFLLVLLVIISVTFVPIWIRFSKDQLGSVIFTLVLVPHIGSILIYLASTVLLAIGGFAKKVKLCFFGATLFTINFLITRLTHIYSDFTLKADYMKFSRTVPEAIKQITSFTNFRSYNMGTNLGAVLLITLGLIAVLVVLLLSVTGNANKNRSAAIVISCIAIFILLCGSIYDIWFLVKHNTIMASGTKNIMSFLRRLPMIIVRGQASALASYSFLANIVKDIYIVIMFGVTALTSAVTIPAKNN